MEGQVQQSVRFFGSAGGLGGLLSIPTIFLNVYAS